MQRANQEHARPNFLPFFLASVPAAILENILFLPFDTMAKCHQDSFKQIPAAPATPLKYSPLPNTSIIYNTLTSLYKGFLPNTLYRVLQRSIMFTGQPIANHWLDKKAGQAIETQFGKPYRTPLIATLAGFATCFMEIPLFPLSTMTVRKQTRGIAYKDSIVQGGLWNGWSITLARNFVAAGLFFGTAAYIRQRCFNISTPKDATFSQEWIASSMSALLATTANHPLDTIKTLMQANTQHSLSGWAVASKLWAEKGLIGFMLGYMPRIAVVAPRHAFAMTVVNQLAKEADRLSKQGLFAIKNTPPSNENLQASENQHTMKK